MKAISLVTELLVDDMAAMLHFYVDLLGFKAITTVPDEKDPFFVILDNNGIKLMLYSRAQFAEEIPHFEDMESGGTTALFLEVDDIDSLYEQFKGDETIIQSMHTSNYGTREFSMTDPSGYVVMFNQHT